MVVMVSGGGTRDLWRAIVRAGRRALDWVGLGEGEQVREARRVAEAQSAEARAAIEEWLEGRRWIRCADCEFVVDLGDGDGVHVQYERGQVVARCEGCCEASEAGCGGSGD